MLISMGRYRQALMVADKWIDAKPSESDAWFCKSACELTLALARDALTSVDRALEVEPKNARYLGHRARCLIGAGRVMDGLVIAQKLVQQEQDNPQLLDSLATTLSTAGEAAEAIPVLERAIALNPDIPQYYSNYGTMLQFNGRTEEAETAHRKALEMQPEDFQGYWLVSRLRRATKQHNFVDWFTTALNTYKDKLIARICINYALGKQHEDLHNYKEAFMHYEAGANAALEHTPYEREGTEKLFEKYRAEFPPSVFELKTGYAENDEAIFIVGMPRSGTTLVERIIASYDNVFAAGELHNFTHLFNERCERLNPGSSGIEKYAVASQIDFEELGEAYIESTRPRTGQTKFFIDKYPLNFQLVGPIGLALPNAKIINLVRNPMDTCFSNYKLLFMLGSAMHSYDQETLAHFYSRYRLLMAHWHACLPSRILDVHYENLVNNPEMESRRIMNFLDLDWRPECLEFYKSREAVTTASTSQIREPINTSSLQKWRHFEAQLQPLRTALEGYEIDIAGTSK